MMKKAVIFIIRILGYMIAILPAASVRIEEKLSQGKRVFQFWSDVFALFPGKPGSIFRCIYYRMVIAYCSLDADIYAFVSIAHRETSIDSGVIITSYTSVGRCIIGNGTGVGSGCHIISGRKEHTVTSEGVDFSVPLKGSSIRIGKRVWIGDGCIIMADIGDGAVVGAGSVVTRPVPEFCVVAGNPAKVIKKLRE